MRKLCSQWDKLSFLFFKWKYEEVKSRIIRAKDDDIFRSQKYKKKPTQQHSLLLKDTLLY